MTHQIIINNFQIDLFIKLMKQNQIKLNKKEKEEIEILIDCLETVKNDKDSNNLHDLTDY